jgi:uridine phosphorylase
LLVAGRLTQVAMFGSEMGDHPLYALEHHGRRVAVYHPLVGAPVAAALLDEIIATGVRRFVVCGGAGVLNREIAVGHLIVPTIAVRDEGTSYHYLPPGREVHGNLEAIAAIERVLKQHSAEYLLAKTWTTDAIYRETQAKVALRRAEGCVTVEMETAAFLPLHSFAVCCLAKFCMAAMMSAAPRPGTAATGIRRPVCASVCSG